MKLSKIYDRAIDWVLTHGPDMVFGIILLAVGLWLIKALKARIRSRMSRKEVHSSLQPFFLSVSITGLNVLLVVLVLEVMGIGISMFNTIFGALTVAIGLALSGTFQNFAGGILILLLKPFELDDSIVAQGQDGKVISIQLFYTVLITADNKTVIIPNGKLFNEVIVNVTREGKRRLDFEIKLGYGADVVQVISIIQDAIKATDKILKEPGNRVGVSGLEIDGVKFVVNVWVNPADFLVAKLALHEKIINAFVAKGIKLPGV